MKFKGVKRTLCILLFLFPSLSFAYTTSAAIKNQSESIEANQQQETNSIQQKGLLEASLLSDVELIPIVNEDGDHISLTLSGNAALNISLLGHTYVYFQLPPEIADVVVLNENLKISYKVPAVGLLGLTLIERSGEFSYSELKDNVIGNRIYADFSELVTADLLDLLGVLGIGAPAYEFTLEFDITHFPQSNIEKYTFHGQATNQNVIDLDIIQNEFASATLYRSDFPKGELRFHHIPEKLEFETTELPTRKTAIQRRDKTWAIDVLDTRRDRSSWHIYAQAEPFSLNDDASITLPHDAFVYVDEQQNRSVLSDEAIVVFSSEGDTDDFIRVQWRENEGPLLYIQPAGVKPGEYSTTITWTLVDAP